MSLIGGKFRLHPTDERIFFDEKGCPEKQRIPHSYYFDGKRCECSVTEFMSRFVGKFNKKRKIKEILNHRYRNSIYSTMTETEIGDLWDVAGVDGSELHHRIDKFYDSDVIFSDKQHKLYVDFEKFLRFHENLLSQHYDIFQSEYIVTQAIGNTQIGGLIDMNAKNSRNEDKLVVDWKRCANPNVQTRQKLDKIVYVRYAVRDQTERGKAFLVMPSGFAKSDVVDEVDHLVDPAKPSSISVVRTASNPLIGRTFSKHLKNSLQLNIYAHILRQSYCDGSSAFFGTSKHFKLVNVYFSHRYDSYLEKECLDLQAEVGKMFELAENGFFD